MQTPAPTIAPLQTDLQVSIQQRLQSSLQADRPRFIASAALSADLHHFSRNAIKASPVRKSSEQPSISSTKSPTAPSSVDPPSKAQIAAAWDALHVNRKYVHEGKGVSKIKISYCGEENGCSGGPQVIQTTMYFTDGTNQWEIIREDSKGGPEPDEKIVIKSNAWRLHEQWHFNKAISFSDYGKYGFAGGSYHKFELVATPPRDQIKLVSVVVDSSGPKVMVRCNGLDGSELASLPLEPEIETLAALYHAIEDQLRPPPEVKLSILMPNTTLMEDFNPDTKLIDVALR